MSSELKKIAILVESSRGGGRGLMEGICQYAAKHPEWQLIYLEGTMERPLSSLIPALDADGMIARINNQDEIQYYIDSGIPTVDVAGIINDSRIPTIKSDQAAVAKLAAAFFSKAGFSHYGYCGYAGLLFSDSRHALFGAEVLDQRGEIHAYASQTDTDRTIPEREFSKQGRTARLIQWVTGLPKPIAIFACNDVRALELSAACREAGIKVPGDVSILGVDNDELLCHMSYPPLSSIELDVIQQGKLAAECLADMIRECSPHRDFVQLIPPIGIIERPSTDRIVSDLPHVVTALRFLRTHFAENLGSEEVAENAGVSRSLLDRDFKAEFGRTVSQELRRLRLSRIMHLLSHSEKSLGEIASLTGFSNKVTLSNFFKSQTGITPGTYRRKHHR